MKHYQPFLSTLITILFLTLAGPEDIFSQTYIDVQPGPSTLTDAIKTNTNPNVIFRLQRGSGAIYLLNGTISVTYPLSIISVDGSGDRPQLIPMVPSGGTSSYPISVKANLTLKGLYITAKDEKGAYLSQILRVQADDIRLIVDDCFLENSSQSAIRTDNKNAKIYLSNSTIRNCASDWANGRAIDDRGVNIDTLYMLNNTIYNIDSRVLRDGGGYIRYAYVNHNTFFNTATRLLDIGECPTVIFKNNLIANCGFLGHSKTATDGLLQISALQDTSFRGITQKVDISNNNFYLDDVLKKNYPDTIIALPKYNAYTQNLVDSLKLDLTNISEPLIFTIPPVSVASIITTYWKDPAAAAVNGSMALRANDIYNFAYPTTAVSYKKGTNNQPLGALTWFGITVGVKNITGTELPGTFKLSQNYPNPFNPSTKITYSIPKLSFVKLEIYNSIGQLARNLVNSLQSAGNYEAEWDGRDNSGHLLTSGLYFYSLKSENFAFTQKMILLK
jgi:hypothetical protein